jgi:hypothetical protein
MQRHTLNFSVPKGCGGPLPQLAPFWDGQRYYIPAAFTVELPAMNIRERTSSGKRAISHTLGKSTASGQGPQSSGSARRSSGSRK